MCASPSILSRSRSWVTSSRRCSSARRFRCSTGSCWQSASPSWARSDRGHCPSPSVFATCTLFDQRKQTAFHDVPPVTRFPELPSSRPAGNCVVAVIGKLPKRTDELVSVVRTRITDSLARDPRGLLNLGVDQDRPRRHHRVRPFV